MKITNYFTIQYWMVSKLNLRGVDRDVYAVIYGFTQDEETEFKGSLSYISELTGHTKKSVIEAIKRLEDAGLIYKTVSELKNDRRNTYRCDFSIIDNVLNDDKLMVSIEPSDGVDQTPSGVDQTPSMVSIEHSDGVDRTPYKYNKDKELIKENNIKRASEPRLSSPKHSRNFQKETKQLTDKLSSGVEIAEQEEKKKRRKTTKEKCLDEIEDSKYQFSNAEKIKLAEYLEWAISGRDNRRIKNVELWRTKLNTLLQLREEGCDLVKVIQNSIEKKWYVFVDEKQDHSKKQTSFRPAGDEKIKSSPFKSREEVQAEMERRTLAGMPDFD